MEDSEVMRLLLAAQVREIAIELRRSKGAVAFRSNRASPDQTFDSFMVRFSAENAIEAFVPEALEQLRSISGAFTAR